MSKWAKFYEKLASKRSDNSIEFNDLINYLERLGGLHGTFERVIESIAPDAQATLNPRPRADGKAKPYQVEQVRSALDLYTGDDNDGRLRG